MAYAEKRGKGPRPWRVKYKRPDGSEACRSGFETKAAALTWGRDEEARIREGRWTDPKDGRITVSEWITRWQRLQDVGPSTTANREYLLRRFIQPDWGSWPLSSLSTEEITDWELRLPARTYVSRRPAGDARSLLCTILGDAAATRPPLIPYNPALRPRNIPVAAWPPPGPDGSFTPPTGRGIQRIPADTPLACWLPVKAGLTPHGLRHSLKTRMTEDGIPEILAERRLGHEVPGMRGLYAHVSQRMRDELTAAFQARWEESLRQRSVIDPHSPSRCSTSC